MSIVSAAHHFANDSASVTTRRGAQSGDGADRKRLLLVVEDNPGDARLLREMLHAQDAHLTELTHVVSMIEAEHHLATTGVDVILLDLGLPDAQGLDAVRRARTVAPGVPLVVLTGLDDESLAMMALQEGAQDYLIKGQIDARSLLRAVRYAIERKVLEDARRAGEHQLLQAQKLESIGRLAGGIAHDFNNMLFAISGYAELLAQDLGEMEVASLDRARLLESVAAIRDAAGRASALTGQLLTFSRQQPQAVTVIDVNAAVASIAPMVRQLIGEQMELSLRLDPGAGRIEADASQIDQIIVNLIVNARDAMPDGGIVVIETRRASPDDEALTDLEPATSYVIVEVTDNGVGMDLATREHLFEPFFTTKDVGKGTGLGLATAHGIVEQAGGRISVQSVPGQGSTFRIVLPCVDAAIEPRRSAGAGPGAGTGRVLVVEDDAAVRQMVSRLLGRAGYDVLAAGDGREALSMTRLGPPLDVLVTDVVMRQMSGIALARTMMDRYPGIGVVMLSGYTPDTLALDELIAQGASFVSKPVSADGLVQAVHDAMAEPRPGGSPR